MEPFEQAEEMIFADEANNERPDTALLRAILMELKILRAELTDTPMELSE